MKADILIKFYAYKYKINLYQVYKQINPTLFFTNNSII